MNDPREFKWRTDWWHCSLKFYPDRIEYAWDKLGYGIEKGKTVILPDSLSPHLSEGRGSGDFKSVGRRTVLLATLTLFSFTLLPAPWRHVGYFFAAATVVGLTLAIGKIRLRHGINVLKRDGGIAIGINVTKWTDQERTEFKAFFSEWLMPNQTSQRNANSRPSLDGSSASETPSSLGPRG